MIIILELFTFIVTFGFTLFWSSNVLIPLFYSLPRTILSVVTKKIKIQAILVCLIAPVMWMIIPIVFGFALGSFLPKVLDYLLNKSTVFVIAQWVAIFSLTLNVIFNPSIRRNIKNEYINFIVPFRR